MLFEKAINTILNATVIEESRFEDIKTKFLGQDLNIKTLAIITAENPEGEEASDAFNIEANTRLREDLSGFDFEQIKGKYGNIPENPYVIYNISYKESLELGKKYNQDSIIFSTLDRGVDGEPDTTHKMIGTSIKSDNVGEVMAETKYFKLLDADRGDNWSEVDGQKFVLPFFEKHF